MKNKGLFCATIFTMCGSFFCGYLSTSAKETGFVALNPEHKFGKVRQGAKITTSFTLKNQGPDGVRVVSFSKKCDCTDIKLEKYLINANESTTLHVTWDMGAKRGKTSSNIEVIYVVSSEETPKKLIVELSADVLPDLNFSPEELRFRGDLSSKQSIVFSSENSARTKILSVQCTHRAFQVVLNRIESRLDIIFDPQLWSQDMEYAELAVKTNSPHEPICRIRLWVDKKIERTD